MMKAELTIIVVNDIGMGRTLATNPYYYDLDPELWELWERDNSRIAVQEKVEGGTHRWCGNRVEQGFYLAMKTSANYGSFNNKFDYDVFYVQEPWTYWFDTNRITYGWAEKLISKYIEEKIDVKTVARVMVDDDNFTVILDIQYQVGKDEKIYHIYVYNNIGRCDVEVPEEYKNTETEYSIEEEIRDYIRVVAGEESHTIQRMGKKFEGTIKVGSNYVTKHNGAYIKDLSECKHFDRNDTVVGKLVSINDDIDGYPNNMTFETHRGKLIFGSKDKSVYRSIHTILND